MSKQIWKPGTMLNPVPVVLVTSKYKDVENVFTVAWTGTICSDPAMTYISVRKERFSYDIIKSSGKFCINLVNENLVKSADYCGVRSGRIEEIKELGSHDMFISKILSVHVDEKYIENGGKLDLQKCNLVTYSHGEYFKLGEKIGKFGYSVRKK